MLENYLSFLHLLLGFVFSFFIPGFCIIETFFFKLTFRTKLPLYSILSLTVSTYLIYLFSLFAGFSRGTIIASIIIFFPWLILIFIKRWRYLLKSIKNSRWQLLLGFGVYFLFFAALYPGIFTFFKGHIVMSSVNWQDTAMHMGIIQSISQGNFPPQASYYAGVPLNYYYFVDFHSAILVTLFGNFFPRVLVYDNPFFAATFTLSLYALGYELTKKQSLSLLTALSGTFFGSYIFVNFFRDVFLLLGQGSLGKGIVGLLSNNTYSMEYEQLFQMANMGDYFLQNRPMMLGLPLVIAVLVLLIQAFKTKKIKTIFLAGLTTCLLFKFQFFAFLVLLIIFALSWLFYFKKSDSKFFFRSLVVFLFPVFLTSLLFLFRSKTEDLSILSLVKENFSFGNWDKDRSMSWHFKFMIANFGLCFGLTFIVLLWNLIRSFRKRKTPKELFLVSIMSLVFFIIPYTLRFTIYKGDMFKFFYFMAPLMVAVSYWAVGFFVKSRRVFKIVVLLLFLTSAFSSILTLTNSALNKNFAYSEEDLAAGLWIRENTPQKSVFLSFPTVHTPISQIGGRLRVLSYINWPYSHGYNSGEDNVFTRLADIERLYSSQDREEVVKTAMKYKADYVYYGPEEKAKAPEAGKFFDSLSFLKKVYSSDKIDIYEI